jgi:hypothetical protein
LLWLSDRFADITSSRPRAEKVTPAVATSRAMAGSDGRLICQTYCAYNVMRRRRRSTSSHLPQCHQKAAGKTQTSGISKSTCTKRFARAAQGNIAMSNAMRQHAAGMAGRHQSLTAPANPNILVNTRLRFRAVEP